MDVNEGEWRDQVGDEMKSDYWGLPPHNDDQGHSIQQAQTQMLFYVYLQRQLKSMHYVRNVLLIYIVYIINT